MHLAKIIGILNVVTEMDYSNLSKVQRSLSRVNWEQQNKANSFPGRVSYERR